MKIYDMMIYELNRNINRIKCHKTTILHRQPQSNKSRKAATPQINFSLFLFTLDI